MMEVRLDLDQTRLWEYLGDTVAEEEDELNNNNFDLPDQGWEEEEDNDGGGGASPRDQGEDFNSIADTDFRYESYSDESYLDESFLVVMPMDKKVIQKLQSKIMKNIILIMHLMIVLLLMMEIILLLEVMIMIQDYIVICKIHMDQDQTRLNQTRWKQTR